MTEATAPEMEGQAEQAPASEGQAEQQAAWYDSAPDEIKGYIQNKGWDDPLKSVEAYQNLEKYHGVPADKLIKLPKDGEPMDEVYNRLGRPESPDKYDFSLPEDMPVDEARLNMAREVAHKVGLNSAQLEALIKMDSEYTSQYVEAHHKEVEQKQQQEMNDLKKDWGSAFDERVELGRRFVRNNIPDGIDKDNVLAKIEEAIGPATMLKLFSSAGEKSLSREDKIPDGSGDRPFGYTPEQAKADKAALISELQASPERLANYNKGVGPDYDKMQRLIKIMSA